MKLSISKALDSQLAILLKKRLFYRLFSRICRLSRKVLLSEHLRSTSEWLLLVFSQCCSSTELAVKKILNCFAGINFLPTRILDALQNIRKTDYYLGILSDTCS